MPDNELDPDIAAALGKGMSLKQVAEVLHVAAGWVKWELDTLTDFHNYCQKFGASPGSNIFEVVSRDALRLRGVTLEQFREKNTEQR